ncbi:MAG: aspartate--tRNA(Asn) ligase [Candidatus Bathyarchaeota archaeon]|nr:aspartate--tRNA(Asn) ligase [Candidatus Bathyarchaeota archaeon]MDH5532097.1 aspartate--tRNA(Asn) ligase [Candidatus Bathyarchaeota archaeon]MDH5712881.1 aspartate--tRNA(Asn) ligase [Candidatus Bathyarchaeota archaeon]
MEIDQLGDWRRTHCSTDVKPGLDGKEVIVLGWVRDIRDLGGIRFVILQDREGTVQITIPRNEVGENMAKRADSLQRQYSIGVKGIVKKTEQTPRGIEIVPSEIRILGIAQHPLPLDVTGRTPAQIDVRLDARVLDLCRDENKVVFRIQHVALAAVREFLSEQGFTEVHTPRIIASATEGGAALFPVDYFGREAFLAQSPQLYKEQLVLAFDRVFEIGSFFRAEESHTRRHLSEFVSIDIEQGFATADDAMRVLEEMVHHMCKAVKTRCQKELKTLKHRIDVPETPFKRFTYSEVVEELNGKGIDVPWGEDVPTPAFRTLGELHPYFYYITDWPTRSKPFYIKPRDDNPELCEAFDLMWMWIELASGGTRVHSKDLLMRRLREQGLRPESFSYHLQVFDYGMPPHAGWAAGLERVMMMLTGKQNIREVVLFPRDRFRLTP